MKLVKVSKDEWMFDDDIIQFPKNNNKPESDFDQKVKAFIDTQMQQGKDINTVMAEVMAKFQDEIIKDMESLPPTPFEEIQALAEHEGYETAREYAQIKVLEELNNPEAYFNLAYLCEQYKDSFLALMVSRECMRLYLQYFPKQFNWKKSQLPWGIIENRPFLRALYQLANLYADNLQFDKACEQGEKLLQVCPIDNLGIREELVDWYMYTKDYEKIIKITENYPEDMFAGVVFGATLAYCYQEELEKAEQAWDIAKEILPEVAHELTKKRHPRPRDMSPFGMTIGGKEQSYYYWQDMGQWWEENDTCQALIEKKRAEKKKK